MSNQEITTKEQSAEKLIQTAVENGANVEQLEKLMNLQERWEQKQAKKAFYEAKSNFQTNKPVISKSKSVNFKTKSGGTTSYKYAPLPDVQKAVDPILAQNQMSYYFEQKQENNKITITCILTHELGYSEKSELSAPADTSGNKNSIQSIGSTVSYLKRYTLENILGISTSEDNDGKTALSTKEVETIKLKAKIQDLYRHKQDNIDEETKERINEVLDNEEINSYAKMFNYLKKI